MPGPGKPTRQTVEGLGVKAGKGNRFSEPTQPAWGRPGVKALQGDETLLLEMCVIAPTDKANSTDKKQVGSQSFVVVDFVTKGSVDREQLTGALPMTHAVFEL